MKIHKIITIGLLTFMALIPRPGMAESGLQTMIYDVYAGGLHAVQARLNLDMRKQGRYDLVMNAHTRGFLGSLAPWKGTFETHGWHTEKGLRPELHKSTTIWQDEPEIKEYTYGSDGTFKHYQVTEDGKVSQDPPAAELTDNTTDALTATLMVMQEVASGRPCRGESEVFDGDRRYKMVFNDQGTVPLEQTRYNVYQGDAAQCTVEVVPLKGKWHEKPRGWMSIQEQGREAGTMPTVWFARLEEGGPAVPVKVRVKTEYGTLFMHLAEYSNDDGVIIAEQRAKE